MRCPAVLGVWDLRRVQSDQWAIHSLPDYVPGGWARLPGRDRGPMQAVHLLGCPFDADTRTVHVDLGAPDRRQFAESQAAPVPEQNHPVYGAPGPVAPSGSRGQGPGKPQGHTLACGAGRRRSSGTALDGRPRKAVPGWGCRRCSSGAHGSCARGLGRWRGCPESRQGQDVGLSAPTHTINPVVAAVTTERGRLGPGVPQAPDR